jgi:hypothetical protein
MYRKVRQGMYFWKNHSMGQFGVPSASDITGSGQQSSWTSVCVMRAWVTEGDGNWGFDEFYHLEIEYTNGRKVHLTDALPATASAFYAATNGLEMALGLRIDWRGAIGEEYRRYKSQHWWSKILTGWHRNKLVVYSR